MDSNITLDGSVSVQSIQIDPSSTLNAGSHTLTLSSNTTPLEWSNPSSFNAGTSTIKLTGDANIKILGDCSTTPASFNNLIMGTITAPRAVSLGHNSCPTVFSVNGDFISGSSASAQVSFVKGDSSSNVTNAVTSYYCASDGGIANITCEAGGPPGPGYSSSPAPGSTLNISGAVGTNPTTTLTVSETGDVNLSISFIQITGTDAAKFSLSPAMTQFGILDSYPSQDVGIVCNGSVAGTFAATLKMYHNDPSITSPATYPLSCVIGGGGGGGSGTPISVSVESDLAFALTFLGIVLFTAFKMRKNKA